MLGPPMQRSMSRSSSGLLAPLNGSTPVLHRRYNFPAFEDESRARATTAARLAKTPTRANSTDALHKLVAPQASSLTPNRSFARRATDAHAAALAKLPPDAYRPKPLPRQKAKPKPIKLAPVEVAVPRYQRHASTRQDGLASRWEAHITKKYDSLHQGVDMAKAFQRMDKNRDGVMDKDEMLKTLLSSQLDVSPKDLDELMKECDVDGDGHISFDEFRNGIMKLQMGPSNRPMYAMGGGFGLNIVDQDKKGQLSATDLEVDEYVQALRTALDKKYDMLHKAFEAMDRDRSGTLSMGELQEVVERFQLPIPLTHVHEVFHTLFDKDGDGQVSYDEFCDKLKQWEGR